MNFGSGYFLDRLLRGLGVYEAGKEMVGAKHIVQSNVVNRGTKTRKLFDNLSLSSDPDKAKKQMDDIRLAIQLEYLGHKGNKRSQQHAQYFKDDISEYRSILVMMSEEEIYEGIFQDLKQSYNSLISKLEKNPKCYELLQQLNNSL